MNKELLERNKEYFGNDKVKKQNICEQLNEKGYDPNDQIALIVNVLIDVLNGETDSKHIQEFRKFVSERQVIKDNA